MEAQPRRFLRRDLPTIQVAPSTPILRVIEIIDRSDAKIALVVDERQKLLGTITDGDVRRGILRKISFNEPAEAIMNRRPRSAAPGQDREAVQQSMRIKGIHQMPVLDAEGRVLDLELLDELLQPPARANWVVLMVGGLGTRLRPLTESVPKPLLSVGRKPILETIVENFVEQGFRRLYFSVNYKNEMVHEYFGDGKKWGAEIRYLHEPKKLGTAGSLALLPIKPVDPLLVMNGDLLTKVNFESLLQFHRSNRAEATMCVREVDFQVPYGVVRMDRHRIRSIDEKPVQRFFVNAGIYVLEPKQLRLIPRNAPLDMPEFFEKLIARKLRVSSFPIREYWLDIGRLDDLERANGEYQEAFE